MTTTRVDARRLGLKVKAFGKTYVSLKALALDHDVDITTLRNRMNRLGLTPEKAIQSIRNGRLGIIGKEVVIRGRRYVSIAEASRQLNIEHGRLSKLMNKYNLSPDEAYEYYVTSLGEATGTRIRIDNRLYPSKTAAAKAYGIPRTTFSLLYAQGLRTGKELNDHIKKLTSDLVGEGFIYLIENSVNNKVYVGLTSKSVTQRFEQHVRAAKEGRKSPLCAAIRKYGPDKFRVRQVLKAPLKTLAQHEQRYIKKFDSIRSGYNQTSGGSLGGKREYGDTVTYRGTRYLDLRHLCNSLRLSWYRSSEFYEQGKSIPWIVKEGLRWNSLSTAHQKAEANGTLVTYKRKNYSIKEFAEVFGINRYTAESRFRKGWTPQEILKAARK